MNKPPGHYRDERGNEYYWDGRQRSYIPHDSFGQFITVMNKITLGVLGVWNLILVAIVVIALLLWALLTVPALIILLLLAVPVVIFVANNQARWDKNYRESQKAQAKIQVDERQEEDEERMEKFRRIGEEIDQNVERRMSEKSRQADN